MAIGKPKKPKAVNSEPCRTRLEPRAPPARSRPRAQAQPVPSVQKLTPLMNRLATTVTSRFNSFDQG